ncbi:MAG: hypothetical protein RDO_1190 [Flavobacteriales endosymbiont of Rhyzopertha dominica]|nr:MAG: hypothetical protein NHG05_00630 [Candidatus Shikimatogenerans bostrichidophilus]
MSYILNLYENNNFINYNISYKKKKILIFNKLYNNFHINFKKNLFNKNNFNFYNINAISINLGPSINYFKIKSLLSIVKGIYISLNTPIITLNEYSIIIFKKSKIINLYNKIIFIFFSYNYNILYYIIYYVKNKKFSKLNKFNLLNKKIINLYKYNKNIIYFINKKYKIFIKNNKIIFINYYYYNYNYKDIINFSYYLYKIKKFINNINLCNPIYI